MNSRRYIPLLLLTLTSCSTLLNKKTYNLTVTSTARGAKAEIFQKTYSLPATLEITRNKTPLNVKLINDTSEVDFNVRSRWDKNMYWNLLTPGLLGAVVDFTNKKRFTYGTSIALDKDDPQFSITRQDYFKRTFATQKGDINFNIAIPEINSFYLQPKGESTKSNTGFLGISAGFEYYYSDKKFVNARFDAVTDFAMPFPVPIDYVGLYEQMYSSYISISNNVVVQRFTFGYGLSFGSSGWYLSRGSIADSLSSQGETKSRRSWSGGLVMNAYHQFSKRFFAGIIYRPALLRTSPKVEFKYEHLITLDLMWKINVRRRKD